MPPKNMKIHSNLRLSDLLREVNLNEEDDAKLGAELEKAFTDAISNSMGKFNELGKDAAEKVKDKEEVKAALQNAPELKQIATESVRRMNRMIAENNVKGRINEEVTLLFLASSAIILPALAQLVGVIATKIAKVLSMTLNTGESVDKFGNILIKFGAKMQEKVIGLIQNGLKFIPGYKKLPVDIGKELANILNILITCSVMVTKEVSDLIIKSGESAADIVKTMLKGAESVVVDGAIAAVKSGTTGIVKFIRTQMKEKFA